MSQAATIEKPEASAVKYCEDCFFFRAASDGNPEGARCTYPRKLTSLALVARGATRERLCESERSILLHDDSCGPEARWFKPRTVSVDDGVRG